MRLSRRSFLHHCSVCAAGAALIGCTDTTGRSVADTVVADTVVADTVVADTVVADTVVADTVVADTVVADTVVVDTSIGDDTEMDVSDDTVADTAFDTTPTGPTCDDQLMGGVMEAVLGFEGVAIALDQRRNSGLDGRLYTDLTTVPEETLVENERFYIRTMYPDLIDPNAAWEISVEGLVDTPQRLSLADLLGGPATPMGDHVLECSGNGRSGGFGLMSAASWAGVRVTDVLDRLPVQASATRLLVQGFDLHSQPSAGGHSTPGASWVFSFEQLAQGGAFFATEMNGVPLPDDHGSPVRLYIPGWYGCSCIKWVTRLELVDDTEPSTGQMREFASRTHQDGVPLLARDFRPASMEQAAMPVRVERWRVNGEVLHRVLGVMWGGSEPTDALLFDDGVGLAAPVDVCPVQTQNQLWTVWQHIWRPPATGSYGLTLRIDDPNIPTLRLDRGYYERVVDVEVIA
ncbi:MAG: DMSO/TMAO reductase YedYZ molybdopterin-dependent catalytic subunit [Myxococcota bacterium]|jgi:DMSO/TMAO reductase YedYZ molybdopterin-dependent catalytic subunit